MIDPVQLTAALIKCPSVTPADAGALDVLQQALEGLGFSCQRLPFGGKEDDREGEARIDNLYARIGQQAPHICFAGHTDVVPTGDLTAWHDDPFGGTLRNGAIWGRGAADMKGAIAAFVSAVEGFLETETLAGSISFLITGDEEGPSVNGTVKMVEWLRQNGEIIDGCIVGEPTNPNKMGEMIKIGRRGSVNGVITVNGTQGHVAYPHLANNPVPSAIALAQSLIQEKLDDGTEHFQPSNLEITSFDVGNMTTNVIPALASVRFNIRYNDLWDRASITSWINARLDLATINASFDLSLSHTAECFRTEKAPFVGHLVSAITEVTGRTPELSTSGGTSDARFIKDICPVVEFGLIGQTMHMVDEHVPTEAITQLRDIYRKTLKRYFSQ